MTSPSPRLVKLTTLLFAVVTIAVAFLALNAGQPRTARAQEPSPTATRTVSASPTPSGTPSPNACSGSIKGGQTAPAVSGATVRLPAGGTYDLIINPPGTSDPTFTVCHAESLSRVTINAVTCREVSESVPNGAAGALIVAQIVESCTTSGVAGATAVSTQPGGPIQPPNTGNAGLAH